MLTLKLFQKIFPLGYTSDFLILIKTAIPLVNYINNFEILK